MGKGSKIGSLLRERMGTLGPVVKNERESSFAANVRSGKTIKQSMLDAGYPLSRAKRGIAGCSKSMLRLMSANGLKLAEFGKSLSLDTLKNIAIGRLATNAIEGTDKGVNSAKILGSHREISLWTPENQAGIIVISAPVQLLDSKQKMLSEVEESKE